MIKAERMEDWEIVPSAARNVAAQTAGGSLPASLPMRSQR